MKEKIDSNSWS